MEPQVIDQLSSFDGLQTEIYIHLKDEELEQIKYASIFSDLVSLYMDNSSKTQMTFFQGECPFFKERKVTPFARSRQMGWEIRKNNVPFHAMPDTKIQGIK